jgi:hypothetical protein
MIFPALAQSKDQADTAALAHVVRRIDSTLHRLQNAHIMANALGHSMPPISTKAISYDASPVWLCVLLQLEPHHVVNPSVSASHL